MPEATFHFARPEWLWALFGLLPVLAWLIFSVTRPHKGPIHLYADEHLLPHLTGVRELNVNERWGRFVRWALLWILAVILVVAGIVTALRGQILLGIVLVIVGLLVGPGGVSVFT